MQSSEGSIVNAPADEPRQMGCHGFAECLLQITWIVSAQLMICLDQPNRRMRTRMSGGVGGGLCKGAPYPDRHLSFLFQTTN